MKQGDIVRFINEVGEGTVIKTYAEKVLVLDEHGFEHEFNATDLIVKDHNYARMVGNSVYKDESTERKISKRHAKHHKQKWQVDYI